MLLIVAYYPLWVFVDGPCLAIVFVDAFRTLVLRSYKRFTAHNAGGKDPKVDMSRTEQYFLELPKFFGYLQHPADLITSTKWAPPVVT